MSCLMHYDNVYHLPILCLCLVEHRICVKVRSLKQNDTNNSVKNTSKGRLSWRLSEMLTYIMCSDI